jgi:small subunit ribosomal protein S6
MALPDPIYDLVLLLDPAVEEERRLNILEDARALIAESGDVVNEQDWGIRPMAFEIRHKGDADYHLLQFRATRELLEELDRTLRITDGVVRYRIIKLRPGTPEATPPGAERPAEATA